MNPMQRVAALGSARQQAAKRDAAARTSEKATSVSMALAAGSPSGGKPKPAPRAPVASFKPAAAGSKRTFDDPSLPAGWVGVAKTQADGSELVYYWHKASKMLSRSKPLV
tara:strand:+ start:374 stop:703 length:330 start_codon:yes stop_codon:yes gene_type:complete